MDVLARVLAVAWDMLYDAGVYVIFGFLAAGLVHLLVSREWMVRHLGGRGFGAVLKAALLGAPLPLCSCSVLPAAYALRSKGASRGATVSFLITTPETGVDSIAITWALMGPLMAIVRPVAAVATGLVAGFFETIRERHEPPAAVEPPACALCQSDSCEHVVRPGRWRRFWRFVLIDMGDDVGPTLTLGLILAGAVTALVPDDFFGAHLASRWVSMLLALAIGLPLYVCATASTPLAAALILKGLSPGAALVFLLAGPATNLATILVVARMLGKASAALYVGTIAVVALVCGAALDLAVGAWSLQAVSGVAHEAMPAWVQGAGAVLLAGYLAHAIGRWFWRRFRRRAAADACADEGDACGDAAGAVGGRPDAAGDACCGDAGAAGRAREKRG